MERLASCAATREFGVMCSTRSKAAVISSPRFGPVPFVVRLIVPSWRLSNSTFDARRDSAAVTGIHAKGCAGVAAQPAEAKNLREPARTRWSPGYAPCCLVSA